MHNGRGTEDHGKNPSGLTGDWECWSRSTRGGVDMWSVDEGIGRKRPSDRRTAGDDRGLGAGIGWQRGGKRTRGIRQRLAQGTPCGRPVREGSTYEQWRLMGGGGI